PRDPGSRDEGFFHALALVRTETATTPRRPQMAQAPHPAPPRPAAPTAAADTVTPSVASRPAARITEPSTGARSVIRALEEQGVDTIFGMPGGAILPTYDPLFDSTKLRHILVRHEQGAGHAASGYASATGKVGVCMATSGPG